VDISILKAGEVSPARCAVFPVSPDTNVYLEIKDRMQEAGKEAEKVKAKLDEARKDEDDIDSLKTELSKVADQDFTEVMQLAERRKLDVEARIRTFQKTKTMFEKMMV
jgi:valyl-tRNA synthetase